MGTPLLNVKAISTANDALRSSILASRHVGNPLWVTPKDAGGNTNNGNKVYGQSTGTPGAVTPQSPLAVKAGENLEAANKVVADTLSGQSYAPFSIASKSALARSEANQRASVADQIHQAGFGGTPMAAGIGNATEAQLLRNRFDNALGLEQARQESMRQGVTLAQNQGNAVNQFELGKMENDQTKLAYDDGNWNTLVANDAILKENLANAKTLNGQYDIIDKWVATNPQSATWLQTKYGGRQLTTKDIHREVTNAYRMGSEAYKGTWGVYEGLVGNPDYAEYTPEELWAESERLYYKVSNKATGTTPGYVSGETSLTSQEALDIANGSDAKAQKPLIDDIVSGLRSGGFNRYDLAKYMGTPMWEPLFSSLKSSGLVVTSKGGTSERESGHGYFPEWDKAYNDGLLVWDGNTLAIITSTSEGGAGVFGQNEYTQYNLKSIKSGNTWNVKAWQADAH